MQIVEYTNEQTQGNETLVVGGKQFPHKLDVNKSIIRLYNHPLCPYAERARLAFLAKEIKHQIVDIDQSVKPDWFLEIGGTVPVIETTDGELIPESAIAVEYALHASNEGIKLLPEDPIEAAKIRLYVKDLDEGFMLAMYMGLLQGKDEHIIKFKEKLRKLEENLNKNTEGNEYFLNRSEVSYADIFLAPVLTRTYFALSDKLSTTDTLNIDDYPKIAKYVENIIHHPKLGKGFGSKWGFVNFIRLKQADLSIKLPCPFDETPSDDTQSLKQLIVGDALTAKPRTNENYIRIYGHHLCPFVQRTLLAFNAKNVSYQFVGVDLTHKNAWHMDINQGLVPIVELTDGKILTESLDTSDWVQDYSKEGVDLYPGDETHKQQLKDIVKEWFDKTVHFILIGFKKEAREQGSGKFVEILEWANDQLPDDPKNIYLGGHEHETMADLMTVPFINNAFLIKETVYKEEFYDAINFDRIPKLKNWYDALFKKYGHVLGQERATENWVAKNQFSEAKVQLFYPLF
jgi:glutathione S-transferase